MRIILRYVGSREMKYIRNVNRSSLIIAAEQLERFSD